MPAEYLANQNPQVMNKLCTTPPKLLQFSKQQMKVVTVTLDTTTHPICSKHRAHSGMTPAPIHNVNRPIRNVSAAVVVLPTGRLPDC